MTLSKTKRSHRKQNKETPLNRNDIRCCCSKLVARQYKDGIIIRCARCKQDIFIPMESADKEKG